MMHKIHKIKGGDESMSTSSTDVQRTRYQITINNPLDKGMTHNKISDILKRKFSSLVYFCMADEMGSTYHTHVFVIFQDRVRFSKVRRHFSEAHVEECIGTTADNIDYIRKVGKYAENRSETQHLIEGSFEEYGTPPSEGRGKSKKMSYLYQKISDGYTNAEIISENHDYIHELDKFDRIRATILMDKFKGKIRHNLRVIYISGPSRVGKTKSVFEKHESSDIYRVTDYAHPFDSYSGQQVIVFDNFKTSLKLGEMLTYCDIYPVELPSRYVNKVACYDIVYIISTYPLEEQYKNVPKNDIQGWNAFIRRIDSVIVFNEDGTITEYDSGQTYLCQHKRKTTGRTSQ